MGHNGGCATTLWIRANLSNGEEPQSIHSPEAETILQAQRGDAQAFERIYQSHSRRIYCLCLRMVRNPAEAEDLTQEAFLRVFRNIRTFRGESAFSTWLHRLAVNVVLMQLRKKNLPEPVLEETKRPTGESAPADQKARDSDAPTSALIDRVNLDRAVEQLPSSHKLVFVLHDIQGYKHHEIAKMVDCSVGTSKGRLHKAHKRLRDLLRENCAPLVPCWESCT